MTRPLRITDPGAIYHITNVSQAIRQFNRVG
jgi:hypothetical protein